MKRFVLLMLVTASFYFTTLPVFGSPQENVLVSVTPTLVSISVSPSMVNLGVVALNQESVSSGEIVVTNNGSVVEDVDMKGSDAVSGAHIWTLSDISNGPEQYMLKIAKGDWSSGYAIGSSYEDYVDGLSIGANQNFKTKILMPTSTSNFTEHTATITLLATEHP